MIYVLSATNIGKPTSICLFTVLLYETRGYNLKQFMEVFSEEPINFGLDTVICDQIVSGRNIKNFLCLMFKQYIYKQRCLNQPISLEQFISSVWKTKGIEKFIAIKNGKLKVLL